MRARKVVLGDADDALDGRVADNGAIIVTSISVTVSICALTVPCRFSRPSQATSMMVTPSAFQRAERAGASVTVEPSCSRRMPTWAPREAEKTITGWSIMAVSLACKRNDHRHADRRCRSCRWSRWRRRQQPVAPFLHRHLLLLRRNRRRPP